MEFTNDSFRELLENDYLFRLGIQILNMKMVFNIYGTWRWVTFESVNKRRRIIISSEIFIKK